MNEISTGKGASIFEALKHQTELLKELRNVVMILPGDKDQTATPMPASKALQAVDAVQENNRVILDILDAVQPLR